jgi:hypothetical protein
MVPVTGKDANCDTSAPVLEETAELAEDAAAAANNAACHVCQELPVVVVAAVVFEWLDTVDKKFLSEVHMSLSEEYNSHNSLAGTVPHTLEDKEVGTCSCTVVAVTVAVVDIVADVGRTVAVHVDTSWAVAVAASSATPIVASAVSLPLPFFPVLFPSMLPSRSYTFLVVIFLRRRMASFLHS